MFNDYLIFKVIKIIHYGQENNIIIVDQYKLFKMSKFITKYIIAILKASKVENSFVIWLQMRITQKKLTNLVDHYISDEVKLAILFFVQCHPGSP